MDKRSNAEIKVGAALNVIEPLEFNLDSALMASLNSDELPLQLVRKIASARHEVFWIRNLVAEIYDVISRAPDELKYTNRLTDWQEKIDRSLEHAHQLLVDIVNVDHELLALSKEWHQKTEWPKIVELIGHVDFSLSEIKRGLIVAGLVSE